MRPLTVTWCGCRGIGLLFIPENLFNKLQTSEMQDELNELLQILSEEVKRTYHWNGQILTLMDLAPATFTRLQALLPVVGIAQDGDQAEMNFNLNQDLGAGNLVLYDQEHFQAEVSYARYKENWELLNIILL